MKRPANAPKQKNKLADNSISVKNAAVPGRYPIWSAKAALLISLPVVAITTLLVFVLSDRSVFIESQITLLIISLCLFAFLTTGLYRGVRLERPDKDELARAIERFDSRDQRVAPRWLDILQFLFSFGPPDLSHVKLPDLHLPNVSDSSDDLVGCLITIVLWIGVLILLVVLMWVLAQVIAALPVLAMALYWVFYRALRTVFAKSRSCKGQLRRSMGYGLLYTAAYVGWVFVLLWMGGLLYAGLYRLAN